jgi:TolB protein
MRLARIVSLLSTLAVLGGSLLQTTPAAATPPGPNGRIAFDSDRYGGGDHNIFSLKRDGTDVQQLTFLTADQGAALDQWWSPDGSKLVYERRNAKNTWRQIYVMNADGSDQHRLFPDPWYRDFDPSYSPDGSTVVFRRCTPDFEGCSIATVDASGAGGVTDLTTFDLQVTHPVYSPDGSKITFGAFGLGGISSAIWVMNADGSKIHRVTPAYLSAYVFNGGDWSPDGARILFNAGREGGQVWTINADGTDPVQLTDPSPKHDAAGTYSPRGGNIVFDRDSAEFSHSSIFVMNIDGSGMHKIQDDAFTPTWGSNVSS